MIPGVEQHVIMVRDIDDLQLDAPLDTEGADSPRPTDVPADVGWDAGRVAQSRNGAQIAVGLGDAAETALGIF